MPPVVLAEARFVTREGPRLPRPFSILMMLSARCFIFFAAVTTLSGLRLALRLPVFLAAAAVLPVPARARLRPAAVPLRRVTLPIARCEPRWVFDRDAVPPVVRAREDAPLLLVRLLAVRLVRAARSLRSLDVLARFARADDDREELAEDLAAFLLAPPDFCETEERADDAARRLEPEGADADLRDVLLDDPVRLPPSCRLAR